MTEAEKALEDNALKGVATDALKEAEASHPNVLNWTTRRETLYGKLFGAKAMEDKWDRHVAFDEDFKCVSFRHGNGMVIVGTPRMASRRRTARATTRRNKRACS